MEVLWKATECVVVFVRLPIILLLDHDTCGPWSLFTGVKGVTGIEGWAGTRSCNLPIFAVLS